MAGLQGRTLTPNPNPSPSPHPHPTPKQVAAFKGVINCVHPNAAIYSFDANMVMSAGDAKKLSLSAEQARPGLHPLTPP